MNQADVNEFHNFLCNYSKTKGFELEEILSIMAEIFIGTMAQNGFNEEKFNLTLLKMKEGFANHPERKNE